MSLRAASVALMKVLVLLFWVGAIRTLIHPFATPFHQALLVVLVFAGPAHLFELWLHARTREWAEVRRSDVLQILVFGAPHLAAIKLRESR